MSKRTGIHDLIKGNRGPHWTRIGPWNPKKDGIPYMTLKSGQEIPDNKELRRVSI